MFFALQDLPILKHGGITGDPSGCAESLSMHDERPQAGRLWPVRNCVIWKEVRCPETKGTGGDVGPGSAAHGRFGDERASVVNHLFHAVGGVLMVIGM